ncbi:iron ABC transporter permease [Rhodobacter sp. CZR27]|uniref:FecCD family ABC transporter permease n=1 Tax=Rhodobacter sp. CZR27 TaxID=2033869 RepID=UPI000BBE11C8|nr:iron ABC transporter permease [Rhodobacter sp. CZR27]
MRTLPLLALVAAAAALSLGVGVRPLSPGNVWQALTAFDATDADHVTLLALRLPRLAAGLVAGAALGIAGTMMQALTRNPLADPGLLGVNAGAACAIVAGGLMLGLRDEGAMAALAFPGAALASVAVFALGGGLRGDAGPVRLTLAGAALNALLLSVVSAILLIRQETLDVFRFWVAGSLTQAAERPLAGMALVVAAAGGLALAVAPAVEALSLGAALARGLGVRPGRVQAAALAVVALATGAAVTVAGPIAFLGLMVPPLARRLAGHALRAELLVSAAMGAAILLLADTAGRVLIAPAEVRAGVMTALIGGPVFILIARRIRPGAMA